MKFTEPVENMYFNWLIAKVRKAGNMSASHTHSYLLKTLHQTEFVWLLSGDDNRAEDGLELRSEFILEANAPDDVEWRTQTGCSMLEMFVAFSRRAAYSTDIPAWEWFWEFMRNLGMDEFTNGVGVRPEQIGEILYNVIWRTYDYNGDGGIFPIRDPKHDQREVEIWYQFCEYLLDQDRLP